MLKILSMSCGLSHTRQVSAQDLYNVNHTFTFEVEAPLYWWIDFDGNKFGFDLSIFEPRRVVQSLPISTKVKAIVILPYREIFNYCYDYSHGEYLSYNTKYEWPNQREWSDFCETLLDIRGIRDLIQEDS